MIDLLLTIPAPHPIIRFHKGDGGHKNAFGGGKSNYVKGSHYKVDVDSLHPRNVWLESDYD